MGSYAVNEVPSYAEYSDDERKRVSVKRSLKSKMLTEVYPRSIARKYHFMDFYLG